MAEVLPPELWTQIFRFTSVSATDIACCRLVCRSFHRLSTEFLIPRVVIAKRPSSLQCLYNVLDHSVLRRYVRELLFDGSSFSQDLASNVATYRRVCETFSKRIRYQSEFRGLVKCRLHQYPENGFMRYRQKWQEQEDIIYRDEHFIALKRALRELPALRVVRYTDYRSLARPQELYVDLCQRLFSDILEPGGVCLEETEQIAEFVSVLRILERTPEARKRSLIVGHHQYECPRLDWDLPWIVRLPAPLPSQQIALPFSFEPVTNDDDDDGDNENHSEGPVPVLARHGFEHLHLPVRISSVLLRNNVGEILRSMAPNPRFGLPNLLQGSLSTLTHLGLSAMEDDYVLGAPAIPKHGMRDLFLYLVDGLVFESLQSLELTNWSFVRSSIIENFLSRHSSTLRELRFLNCKLHENPSLIAKWAGEKMFLNGVEIDLQQEIDEEENAGRGDGEGAVQAETTVVQPLLYSKDQLETLWLAGRQNSLQPSDLLSLASRLRLLKDSGFEKIRHRNHTWYFP